METFSALLAVFEGIPSVTGEFPRIGQCRLTLMFSLICARTNGWGNNRGAGDLRRHRAHYDVTANGGPIDQFILRSQYHGCWLRRQVISSHGIVLVLLEYPGLSPDRGKLLRYFITFNLTSLQTWETSPAVLYDVISSIPDTYASIFTG